MIAEHSINILAYCAYSDRQEAVVLVVTDNPYQAKAALTSAGYSCRATSVVLVGATDQIGSAAAAGVRLGMAGVNILYSYASSAGAEHFYVVFKTNDDHRALLVLDPSHPAVAAA